MALSMSVHAHMYVHVCSWVGRGGLTKRGVLPIGPVAQLLRRPGADSTDIDSMTQTGRDLMCQRGEKGQPGQFQCDHKDR